MKSLQLICCILGPLALIVVSALPAEEAIPTLSDFHTADIPLDGFDAPAITNHWIWAQADGRFGKGILNMEDVRAGAGPMLDGTVVVKMDGQEVVAKGSADWRPNQVTRRAEMNGLVFTGTVRAADRQIALLSRVDIDNPSPDDHIAEIEFNFAMHSPLAALVESGGTVERTSTYHRAILAAVKIPAGLRRSFRIAHLFRGSESDFSKLTDHFDAEWDTSDRYWNTVLEDAFTPGPGPFLSGGMPNLVFDDPEITKLYRFGVVAALMLLKNDPDRRTPCNWYGTSMPDASYGAISQGNCASGRRCRSGWASVAGATMATMVQQNFATETCAESPRIECDARMLARAQRRIATQKEPFHTYWQLALADVEKARNLEVAPYTGPDSLAFHAFAQEQGTAARLLAYAWRLQNDRDAGSQALSLLDSWASASPLPGTAFDPGVRFPNSGMDVARGMLPFVVAYDLLHGHPGLTAEKRARIDKWFQALARTVKEGIRRWENEDDFGKQEFQNHHAAHVLGLVLFGVTLRDEEMIRFAVDSPDNPKDFKELIAGLILMPGDEPHGGLRGKPLHAGELQDRYRTNEGAGLTYCHLTLTLMLYTADALSRTTGEDYLNWQASGGECLRLSATFYSDFFRLRNAHLHGDYYFRDVPAIRNSTPYLGTFEVALHHWPDVPNLKAIVRSIDRARTPRSWLCYYGLPLLTHGVENP